MMTTDELRHELRAAIIAGDRLRAAEIRQQLDAIAPLHVRETR